MRIYRLSDLSQNPAPPPNPPPSSVPQRSTSSNFRYFLFPETQQGWTQSSFFKYMFPDFQWLAVTTLLTVAILAMYIATLVKGVQPINVLNPKIESVIFFGSNNGRLIKSGQVWRLVTAIFLHLNIYHILFNLFVLLQNCYMIEARYGSPKLFSLFLASGICGNYLSNVANFCSVISAGASTSLFGIFGLMLAELVLSWHLIQQKGDVIMALLMNILLMVLLTFMWIKYIDVFGHLGGLLSGFWIGVLFNYKMEHPPRWHKIGLIVSAASLAVFIAVCNVAIWVIPHGCT